MLQIVIPGIECYDEIKNEFITTDSIKISMEHSLLSLSKWESKWHKPFLDGKDKSYEETIDYYRCMTLTKNVDSDIYYNISVDLGNQINDYIADSMTATWFNDKLSKSITEKSRTNGSVVTSEVIYYYMISLGIPFECQKWHLNRLITLIRVISEKNAPKKKMSNQEILTQQADLNAKRRAELNSKG